MTKENGIIVKGIGGFYYVEVSDKIYECKARGLFRKEGIKPFVGDRVVISVNEKAENTIDFIETRTTLLFRPPVANVDKLFIVSSTCEPNPSLFIIDRMTALATIKGIEPVIVFTKNDLKSADDYIEIYKKVGIKAFAVSNQTGEGVESVGNELEGHISAFAGNTGVGKSSLLNAIDSSLALKTGEISDKLGRGRHTTRHSELFKINGGYVADTPGFSSLDADYGELITKDELPYAFGEFSEYLGLCKFTSCLHIKDKGCRILSAVEDGDIPKSRHDSYCLLMEQAKNIKEWELKNKSPK